MREAFASAAAGSPAEARCELQTRGQSLAVFLILDAGRNELPGEFSLSRPAPHLGLVAQDGTLLHVLQEPMVRRYARITAVGSIP